MHHRCAILRGSQAGRLILLALLAMAAGAAAAAALPDMQAAARLGLDWIERHPAGPEDGGLADMIDEAVSLRVFETLAAGTAQGGRSTNPFRSRMARLEQQPGFRQWVTRPNKTLIEHYHLVLAAWLIQQAGLRSPLTATIAGQAQHAISTASHEHPTVRLTTALFLARLDPAAQPDLQSLLAQSLTEQLSRNPRLIPLPAGGSTQQRRATTWLLYALLHEVVALTDFGRLAAPPWLAARRHAVTTVLLQAVPWASAQHNWDLAAELLTTLYFLGQPLNPELRAALEQLVRKQQPDGSWGASSTSGRSNKVRHTVLTATAALMAWSSRDDK